MKPVFHNHFHYALWLDAVRNTPSFCSRTFFPPSHFVPPCYYLCEETYTELVASVGQLDHRKLLNACMNDSDCAVGSIFAIGPHLWFSIHERLYKEAASPGASPLGGATRPTERCDETTRTSVHT